MGEVFNQFFAKSDGTSLEKHLTDVVQAHLLAENPSNKEDVKRIILEGLFHDIGKCSPSFQISIMGRMEKKKNKEEIEENKKIKKEKKEEIKQLLEIDKDLKFKKRGFRHEFFSIVWLAYFDSKYGILDSFSDEEKKKIINAIAWHHRNNLTLPEFRLGVAYAEEIKGIDKGEFLKQIFDAEHWEDLEEKLEKIENWLKENEDIAKQILEASLSKIETKLENEEVKSIIQELKNKLESNVQTKKFTKVFLGYLGDLGYLPSPTAIKEQKNGKTTIEVKNKKVEILKESGKLKRSDYFSSAIEELGGHLEDYLRNIKNEIDGEELVKAERPKTEEELWQEKLINEKINEIKDKRIYLLEAPTGSGKTYFAYYLAKVLKKNEKIRKVVYILPYRAALNEKFENLRKKDIDVGLLHSTSVLEFEGKQKENDIEVVRQKELLSTHYFYPILLSTADQTMLVSLEFYPFDFYLPLFESSLVILDEPQAYSIEQMAIILMTINTALSVGARVLIMTATFPDYIKSFFGNKILDFNIDEEIKSKPEMKIRNWKNKRHKIKLITIVKENEEGNEGESWTYEKLLEEIFNEYKNEGKKVLVVMNTVNSAKEIYEKLKEKSKNDQRIFLLHSRLGWQKKNEILDEVGMGKSEEPWLLVSTQVVEAAVNIDADVLYTAISPVPSQVQRWGRVYRDPKNQRDLSEPNIFILYSQDSKLKNKIIGKNIYKDGEIEISMKILKSQENKGLGYDEEKDMVEDYYRRIIEKDKSRLEEIIESFPMIVSEIETKKEAHTIFRPEDWTEEIIVRDLIDEGDLKRTIEEIINNSEEAKRPNPEEIVKLKVEALRRVYTVPKWKLNKLVDEGKLENLNIHIPGLGIPIYSLIGKEEEKGKMIRIIKEYGLEFLLERK